MSPRRSAAKTGNVSKPRSPSAARLVDVSQNDIGLMALLLQGGDARLIHLEHVSEQCFRLAPARFRWRYFNYPSMEAARFAMRRLSHHHKPPLAIVKIRSDGHAYQLTEAGIAAALAAVRRFYGVTKRPADTPKAARHILRSHAVDDGASGAADQAARRAILGARRHPLFAGWQLSGRLKDASLSALASVLQCLPDAPAYVWRERLEQLTAQAIAWQDSDVRAFLAAARDLLDKTVFMQENHS